MNSTCDITADEAFDPVVQCSRRDFTLYFEQIFFSILPSALLLLATPFRLWYLHRQQRKVTGTALKYTKVTAYGLLSILQLIIIIIWASQYESKPRTSIAAAVLTLVTSLTSCALSLVEHSRSIRPSMLLNGYLFVSLLLDAAILRTLWTISFYATTRNLFTACFIVKGLLVIFEAREKRSYLCDGLNEHISPETTSGLYSSAIFWWLNGLIRNGYRRVMSLEDLYPVTEEMKADLLAARFLTTWHHNKYSGKHKLVLVAVRAFRWEVIWTVIPRLVLIAFTICQPLLVTRFLTDLQSPSEREDASVGWALVGAYALVYLGVAFTTGFYWHRNYKALAMLRASLVTAIFKQTTIISVTALDNSAAVTLMGTDVDRVIRGLHQAHELWANVIQIAIATWLLDREIGIACLGPLVVAIGTAAMMAWLSGKTGIRQKVWVKEIHKRTGITSKMLGHMKGVKMLGLSDSLSSSIQELRVAEMKASKSFRLLQVWGSTIGREYRLFVSFAIFVAISRNKHQTLDVNTLFTSLSILLLVAGPLFTTFAGFMELMSAVGCFERIETFLSAEVQSDHRLLLAEDKNSSVSSNTAAEGNSGIELVRVQPKTSVSRHDAQEAFVIRDGTFGWAQDDSPVLQNINLSIQKANLTMIIGPVASGKSTLLKAMLGETPSSKGFVYVSTKECAWCDQTAWLINASVRRNIIGFEALDQQLYQTILHACQLSQDIAAFPHGDETLIGSKGITLSEGQKQRIAIARALYSRKQIVILDDVFSGLDQHTKKHVSNSVLGPGGLLRRWGCTVILVTHAVNLLPMANHIISLGRDGCVAEQGSFADLQASDGYVKSLCLASRRIDDAESVSAGTPGLIEFEIPARNAVANVPAASSPTRQTGDVTIYTYYFATIGPRLTIVFLGLAAFWGFINAFPTIWLKWWADANDRESNEYTGYYIGIYAMFQAFGLLSNAAFVWFTFNIIAPRAGLQLHRTLLKTVMNAPMLFFAKTDIGSITTRFSQDIQLIDGQLPLALMCVVSYIGVVLAQIGLIASASPYIAICFPLLFVVFYFLQSYYLRTSRQLSTQFLETLSGLTTIRAFNWSNASILHNYTLVDASTQPYYLLYMIQRWLTLILDLITTGVAILVVSIAVKTRDDVSIGSTGVSLTQLISFTSILKMTISFWGQLETSIGAVKRIRDYEKEVESEHGVLEVVKPPMEWPQRGKVVIHGLSVSYSGNAEEKVLDDISLNIEAGQKMGICGRTGSTLILALFRLIDSLSGSIKIDDLDISTINRQSLRSQLNSIAQEPVFIHGTVRQNLDPYDISTETACNNVLSKVDLLDVINNKGGLSAHFDEEFLSHGQRQLFCLARAILRKERGRLVVLDEVTSSVDQNTDEMMQKLIREEFKAHTVIAVAHRLENIVDFDVVVVMDGGMIAEMGKPEELLARDGLFRRLWDANKGLSR